MDHDLLKLGKRLRELREKAGLSQEALADLACLHRTYIGGIERGERNVGVQNLIQIARAMKLTPSELLKGI
jgi:transcriptional regulator with XRE-family HTH domain